MPVCAAGKTCSCALPWGGGGGGDPPDRSQAAALHARDPGAKLVMTTPLCSVTVHTRYQRILAGWGLWVAWQSHVLCGCKGDSGLQLCQSQPWPESIPQVASCKSGPRLCVGWCSVWKQGVLPRLSQGGCHEA